MMGVMQKRSIAATALLAASFLALSVSVYRYVWPGEALAPRWLSEAKVDAISVPAFPITTSEVEMRRGDSLVQALARGGLSSRSATLLATQFGKNGADLRKIRAGATIEITWNARHEPLEVRYEASPWLTFQDRARDGSWRGGRARADPHLSGR